MKNNLILTMILSMLSVFVIGTLNTVVNAQENMTNSEELKFFAIQHANSGSIIKINDTAYSLELNDVSDKTILFSDRPDRIVISESTSDFIDNWTTGDNSFAVDAPNAVLVVDWIDGMQDVEIVELFSPVYDYNKKALKYDITPVNATSIELPSEFGQLTLIVDEAGRDHIIIRDENG